jgi:membrane-associated phospholipid phosphatase
VYLGVHYPSDVVGGCAAGLALALCGLWVEARIQAVPLAARLTVVKEEVPPPELLSFPEVEERVA